MRPLGLNEALSFAPAGVGPRVSVFLNSQPDEGWDSHAAFLTRACRRARDLIEGSYGRELAALTERELRDGLNELAASTRGKQGTFAYLWSRAAARPFKLPIEVPEQVVISEAFHIKPFVEARELKQDFLLIADQGSRLEVYRVLPAKLCQLAIFPAHDRCSDGWVKPAVAIGIADTVRWATKPGPIPILIAADGGDAEWLKDVLSWIDVPKFTLSTRHTVELHRDSLFAAARQVMDPWFELIRSQAVQFLTTPKYGEVRLLGIDAVGAALASGDVTSLFVADDACIWGTFNSKTGKCVRHARQVDAHDGDILNSFTHYARGHGIAVHVVPASMLPGESATVAICPDLRRAGARALALA